MPRHARFMTNGASRIPGRRDGGARAEERGGLRVPDGDRLGGKLPNQDVQERDEEEGDGERRAGEAAAESHPGRSMRRWRRQCERRLPDLHCESQAREGDPELGCPEGRCRGGR